MLQLLSTSLESEPTCWWWCRSLNTLSAIAQYYIRTILYHAHIQPAPYATSINALRMHNNRQSQIQTPPLSAELHAEKGGVWADIDDQYQIGIAIISLFPVDVQV